METFEKISAEACCGKEIAGLLMMMMMKNMMTRKIVKSRMTRVNKLEAGMNELGICIARYESKSYC